MYAPKFKKMRKQYMVAMPAGEFNDDVVARMQKHKGKLLTKEEQLRDELALTLLTDMNDQKQFGNKFMVAVNEANVYGVAPEIVSDCMLRAAHICLSKSLPSAAESKLRKELREQIDKKLENLSSLELRALMAYYEEDEKKRREQERANEQQQLKLSKDLQLANVERSRREIALLNEKEALRKEIEEQKMRLIEEERAQRRWRSLAAEDQRNKEAWMAEREAYLKADALSGNAQGRRWRADFQKFLQNSQQTVVSIIDNLATPFKLKQIKPNQNDGKSYVHDEIQYQIVSNNDLPQLTMEAFDAFPCLDGNAVVCVPMMCAVRYQSSVVVCKSLRAIATNQGEEAKAERKRSALFAMVMDMIYGEKRSTSTEATMHDDFPDDIAVVLYLLKLVRSVPVFGDPAIITNFPEHLRQHLFSAELIRRVQMLFATSDVRLHALCLRLLFLIFTATLPKEQANQQFYAVCAHFCNGDKFSHPVNVALFSILLYSRDVIASQTEDDALSISFYVPVTHPGVWPALFVCLKECDLHLRRAALQDINTIIYNNLAAVQAVGNSFAMNVISTLADVQKERQTTEPEKSVYVFAMNILVQICMVNFSSLETTQPFSTLFESIFSDVHHFAGYTFNSCDFAGNFLYHTIKQLSGSTMHMSFNCDFDGRAWINLQHVIDFTRWYVFRTSYWRSPRKTQNPKKGDQSLEGYFPKALGPGEPKTCDVSTTILEKVRVFTPFVRPSDESDFRMYGLHFNVQGAWKDLSLVELISSLLKALHVDSLNRDLLGSMEPLEVEARSRFMKEFEFWSQACELNLLRKPLWMSYRKLADYILRFVKGPGKPERDAVIDDIKKLKEAEEKAQADPKRKKRDDKRDLEDATSTQTLSSSLTSLSSLTSSQHLDAEEG